MNATRITTVLAALVLLTGAAAAEAQDAAAVERGRAKYEHSCVPCHGRGPGDDGREMLPGTEALAIKYDGALPPVLEDRSDLNADLIRVFVRRGSGSMPPFRPTELTDTEIDDIAAYIASTSSSGGGSSTARR